MILPFLAGDRLFLGSSAILLIFDFLKGEGAYLGSWGWEGRLGGWFFPYRRIYHVTIDPSQTSAKVRAPALIGWSETTPGGLSITEWVPRSSLCNPLISRTDQRTRWSALLVGRSRIDSGRYCTYVLRSVLRLQSRARGHC